VRIITRAERDALVLPEESLVPQGTDQYVFKIADGKVARIKVETGQRRDGKVEIVSGVNVDDLVVTAGQLKLREGVAVRVAGGGEPSKAATASPNDGGTPAPASGLVAPANATPARAPKS
jgi:membrane fusion protein (multidrug efflux system)